MTTITDTVRISIEGYEFTAALEFDEEEISMVGLYPAAAKQDVAHLLFTHGAHDIDFRDVERMAVEAYLKRGREAAAAAAYDEKVAA